MKSCCLQNYTVSQAIKSCPRRKGKMKREEREKEIEKRERGGREREREDRERERDDKAYTFLTRYITSKIYSSTVNYSIYLR